MPIDLRPEEELDQKELIGGQNQSLENLISQMVH
jgi:hypothetical protein